jgi:hypothetical protein
MALEASGRNQEQPRGQSPGLFFVDSGEKIGGIRLPGLADT